MTRHKWNSPNQLLFLVLFTQYASQFTSYTIYQLIHTCTYACALWLFICLTVNIYWTQLILKLVGGTIPKGSKYNYFAKVLYIAWYFVIYKLINLTKQVHENIDDVKKKINHISTKTRHFKLIINNKFKRLGL